MRKSITLSVHLLSDATFGRGDGLAGLVDAEIEYDSATGLPFIRGSVLKGLLAEECANILYAVKNQRTPLPDSVCLPIANAAFDLFGTPGSTLNTQAKMKVGPAQFPEAFRQAVAAEIEIQKNSLNPSQLNPITATDMLNVFTAIRTQTAVDDETGAPDENSLRSSRVLLRDTHLFATVDFTSDPSPLLLGVLAACVQAVHRGGSGRNRGRGRLQLQLWEDAEAKCEITSLYFKCFQNALNGEAVCK